MNTPAPRAGASPHNPLDLPKDMAGRDFLEAVRDGEMPRPPIAVSLAMWIDAVGDGTTTIKGEPDEHHPNPYGTLSGSYIAALIDSATSCAFATRLPAGVIVTTVGLNLNIVRSLRLPAGPLLAEGKVVHIGSRIGMAEATVRVADTGKMIAHGTSTLLRVSPA
jgi:uncharacterized protein (TIGR00369 family)